MHVRGGLSRAALLILTLLLLPPFFHGGAAAGLPEQSGAALQAGRPNGSSLPPARRIEGNSGLPHSSTISLYRSGDNLQWAAPGIDESEGWSTERPRTPGNWWMRSTLHLQRDARPGEDVALRVFAPGAVEVYWDGALVARDGVIGHDAASEAPGRLGVWGALDPGEVGAGEHVVAVRISSHRIDRIRGLVGIHFLNRSATEQAERLRSAFFVFCAGLLLFTGLVFAFLRRPTGGRVDTLLFALLTATVGALLLLEHSKYVYSYPYTWHIPRLIVISMLTGMVGLLLPSFVASHLQLGHVRKLAGLLALVYIGILPLQTDPDVHSLSILRISIAVAAVLALLAATLRRPGALWIVVACTANLVPVFFTGYRFADHWFFIGFLVMVAVLLFRMGSTLRFQAREREAALLQVERLRFELLRKTIQPHFLMNSLAVAISAIEESPARGIRLLRDLARQIEAFLRLIDRDAVPLAEELELCRMHVRTMEHLLDHPLELSVVSIDAEASGIDVPPGVVLTLVENAVTHGSRGAARIEVRVRRKDGVVLLEIENDAATEPPAPVREGTGLRFVRAQLARDPDAQWQLTHGHRAGRWLTTLSRRAGSRAGRGRASAAGVDPRP